MAKYYYHSLFLIFFVNIIITIISLLNKTVRVKSLQTAYPVPPLISNRTGCLNFLYAIPWANGCFKRDTAYVIGWWVGNSYLVLFTAGRIWFNWSWYAKSSCLTMPSFRALIRLLFNCNLIASKGMTSVV